VPGVGGVGGNWNVDEGWIVVGIHHTLRKEHGFRRPIQKQRGLEDENLKQPQ